MCSFNFWCFPRPFTGHHALTDRRFLCQTGSLGALLLLIAFVVHIDEIDCV